MEEEFTGGSVLAMEEEPPFVAMPSVDDHNIYDLVSRVHHSSCPSARYSLHRAIAHQVRSVHRTSSVARTAAPLSRCSSLSFSACAESLCAVLNLFSSPLRSGPNATGME